MAKPKPYIPSKFLRRLLWVSKTIAGVPYYEKFEPEYRQEYAEFEVKKNGDPPHYILEGMSIVIQRLYKELLDARLISHEMMARDFVAVIMGDRKFRADQNETKDTAFNRVKQLVSYLMSHLLLMAIRDYEGNLLVAYRDEHFLEMEEGVDDTKDLQDFLASMKDVDPEKELML